MRTESEDTMYERGNGSERVTACTLSPCPVCAPATERARLRAELEQIGARDPLFAPFLGSVNAYLDRAEYELDREDAERERRSAPSAPGDAETQAVPAPPGVPAALGVASAAKGAWYVAVGILLGAVLVCAMAVDALVGWYGAWRAVKSEAEPAAAAKGGV